ncbi:purine nucleoside phosphorylase [Thioflavicoccus mobilis 8321]|uniref:Probable S-methyl-5'-thioinosine phosphorylase n=1 Tax=Thioflavicoccus mobilis 8321 TaxID=765912 RepID=L0GZ58_9GAMM|nr:S-methyl-5'-thioinosine phosphorylase [Thioflavicoccus mobilis]AGA90665.1 purine nucleoside phosphorylase [Thioflavicoccus mobilis 8321]
MGRLAIIGGSGFTAIAGIGRATEDAPTTPYGPPSAAVSSAMLGGREVLFLPRHGAEHTIPPHRINYRANLWALRAAGASHVVGLGAVGGITPAFGPCVLAVPDQLIDYTYGRAQTYHDTTDSKVVHIDFSAPYCASLCEDLLAAGQKIGIEIVPKAVYGVTQGPRLETAAEVRRLERDGCDLVGMTGMPEAALARELGLCYASLSFVVNWAAGKAEGEIQMSEIKENVALCTGRIEQILAALTPTGA